MDGGLREGTKGGEKTKKKGTGKKKNKLPKPLALKDKTKGVTIYTLLF